MAPLTAILLKQFLGTGGGRYHALLPETGTVLPYDLSPLDGVVETSMGETIVVDSEMIISSVTYKVAEFRAVRCYRRRPRWSADWTKSRLSYTAAPEVEVEDHVLISDDKEVEASCARARAPVRTEVVAVFIGGTGPYSRHGFAGRIDLGYHQLLDDLARLGIASVRYDKFDRRAANLAEAEDDHPLPLTNDHSAQNTTYCTRHAFAAWLPSVGGSATRDCGGATGRGDGAVGDDALAGQGHLQLRGELADSLGGFVGSAVMPGSLVITDDWSGYGGLRKLGYDHHAIAECGDPEVAEEFLPIIHLIFSNLKTWLNGIHHGVSAKHLQAYLNECKRLLRAALPAAADLG